MSWIGIRETAPINYYCGSRQSGSWREYPARCIKLQVLGEKLRMQQYKINGGNNGALHEHGRSDRDV